MLPTQDELDLRMYQYKITKELLKKNLEAYSLKSGENLLCIDDVMGAYDMIAYDVGYEMSQKVAEQK